MRQSFFIPGPLPGANDIIRKHHMIYSKLKSEWGGICAVSIRQAKLKPMASCSIRLEWREKNWRRDGDNIQFGQKFVNDALVQCGILKNDTRRFIKKTTHIITIDHANPGVFVTLVGCE